MRPNTEERFWGFVDRTLTCWNWLGRLNRAGYGDFFFRRQLGETLAHRIAWRLTGHEIPEGLQLDHLCRNRRCVNPAHLEPVTSRVNTLRGTGISVRNAARTHCPHGHPLDGRKMNNGAEMRYCKTCCRQRERERYQALSPAERRVVIERHWHDRLRREGRALGV